MGKVERIRESDGKTSCETAYYLLSAPLSPERLNEVVRSHWGMIVSDHGTGLTSNAVPSWASENRAEWRYIALGKPTRNSFCESLNGQSRRR